MSKIIYHLAPKEAFEKAGDVYFPAGFEAEGFVHCTADLPTLHQIANHFYGSQPGDFIVVALDEDKLKSTVKHEAPAHIPGVPSPSFIKDDTLFPHIFGGVDKVAVTAIYDCKRDASGVFVSIGPNA
eukprot:Colp12_sorted_trinity150504_noHs@4988